MSEFVLQIDGLRKSFGALVATDNVTLNISAGETHALIGPNGAGKTTLVGQLTGEITPDAGTIRFAGRDITALSTASRARLGLARSFQITSIFPTFTSEENVALAVQATEPHSFRFWRPAAQIAKLREPARNLLADVGLAPAANRVAAAMSHGQHRQLELAMALATRPAMLLLDEPMAGLGIEESRAMSQLLASVKGRYTILLIEHDMDVVFQLADRISVLVGGRIVASGSPDEIRSSPEVRIAYLGDDDDEFVGDALMLKVEAIAGKLRPKPSAVRHRLRGQPRRDGDVAWPQRHGQDHHHPRHHGHDAAARRLRYFRRQAIARAAIIPHRQARPWPRARGPLHLPEPHRLGKSYRHLRARAGRPAALDHSMQSSTCFPGSPNAATKWAGSCPVASSRCWRSRAR